VSAQARRTDVAVAGALAAWTLALAAFLVASGAGVTREDGYYYLQIARNAALGRGSTFDGVTPTNGYHPLWMLALVPVFRAFPGLAAGRLAAVVLQALLLAGGVVVLYALLRRRSRPLPAALAATLWVAVVYRQGLSGLEFALHALCVMSAAALYARRRGAPSPPADLLLGLLLAASFLARLENGVLAAVVIAAVLASDLRAGRPVAARLVRLALPVALAASVYASVNLSLFGAAHPVSGALKREWARYFLERDPRYVAGGWAWAKLHQLLWPVKAFLRPQPPALAVTLALGVHAAAAALAWQRLRPRPTGVAARVSEALTDVLPFVLYGLLQLVATVTLYHGEASYAGSSWYYVVQPMAAALVVAAAGQWALDAARERSRAGSTPRWASGLLAAALAVLAARTTVAAATAAGREMPDLHIEAAEWADRNLPPGAVLASWNAGALGYLSGRRVVNLDGLVNSWSFFRGERDDLCAYWERTGVTHLVDLFDVEKRPAAPLPVEGTYTHCVDRLEPVREIRRYGTRWRLAVYRFRPRA
jgi:hypothetical protein